MKKVLLASIAAFGLAGLTMPGIDANKAAVNSVRPASAYSWSRKKRSKDGGTNPNTLPDRERQKLLERGTHFRRAGAARSRKKLTNHLPRGYVVGSGCRAERAAIGVNGIRGSNGGGR